jgi:hypothetical protein
MGVAEAVAQAGNAHTTVDPAEWREWLNSAPVRLQWFEDGLFVVRATTPFASLLGTRVLAIDGYDPQRLVDETQRYISGTLEHARAGSSAVLESPQALHVMHPEAPDDRLRLRVRGDGGVERTVDLPAVAPAEAPPGSPPGRVPGQARLAREKPELWHSVLEHGDHVPEVLRDADHRYHVTKLDEGRVLYVHLWRISNGFDPEVGKAIEAAIGAASEPPWRRIILDLRFNGGGEYPTVHRAIKRLARRVAPDGKLVILTDNATFSGGIVTAALAKHFGGKRALVIGEKAGDRLAFWAEGGAVLLPNSRIRVNISTGFHDWANGCRDLRCYWPNVFLGVGVGSIDPDIPMGWPFADYRRGDDPVLARALR